jgi:PAS domain-containing protein
VHLAILGGEAAVMMRPAFASYCRRGCWRSGIPVFLSAASPYILLNDHLEEDAEPVFLNSRLAELYGLLHAARFGRSLLEADRFPLPPANRPRAPEIPRNQRDQTA